jgi:hypothetical protein
LLLKNGHSSVVLRNIMKIPVRAILKMAVLLCLAVAAPTFYVKWTSDSSAVPLRQLSLIRSGMTMTEVANILGEPDEAGERLLLPGSWPTEESWRRYHEVVTLWFYRSRFKLYVVRIEFAEDGTVVRYLHELRQREAQQPHPDLRAKARG